jgi:putative two-component system response regulator
MKTKMRMTKQQIRSRVLVVDDDPGELDVLGGILSPYYEVFAAPSGERALAIAADAKPDLILLDVMMQFMSGYEVLDRLKKNPVTHKFPVIFVTSMFTEDDEVEGLSIGAADYIVKPYKPAIVLARVRTHIELSHLRELFKS